jgi:hypothetical protein
MNEGWEENTEIYTNLNLVSPLIILDPQKVLLFNVNDGFLVK